MNTVGEEELVEKDEQHEPGDFVLCWERGARKVVCVRTLFASFHGSEDYRLPERVHASNDAS